MAILDKRLINLQVIPILCVSVQLALATQPLSAKRWLSPKGTRTRVRLR